MANAEPIRIDIVYALPERQRVIALQVEAGTCVADAVRQSGILAEYPEIDLARMKVGIFSRRVDPHALLRDGDRIEIYRPLLADPKNDAENCEAHEDYGESVGPGCFPTSSERPNLRWFQNGRHDRR